MTTDRGHVARVTIPLRYRDLDTLGHVNQSVYHVLLEEARVGYILEAVDEGLGEFVVARVEMDYRHEVRLEDREVVIETWLDHVGGSSIRLASRISKPDGTVAAECLTVLVGWDTEQRRSRTLTDGERRMLGAAQGTAA